LEDLLIRAVNGEDYEEPLMFTTSFYQDDLDVSQLRVDLQTLHANIHHEPSKSVTLSDIKGYIQKLTSHERGLLSEVVTVLKLILVMPSTNAVSQRSFSALKRLKTYLRSTMKQDRLNYLLLLHVHKNCTDELSLTSVGG
jgi:predicted unusual protein kinase regulating ubiquinone biosynthesis (AarF/ABC1/UbiB family)